MTGDPALGDAVATGAWELPEELRMLQSTVRSFMRGEVGPLEDTLPHDCAGVPEPQLAALQAKARSLGLWALQTPARFGGAGLGVLGQVVVAEEAAKCRMGAFFPACGAFGGNPPNILFNATPAQFEKYARPIIDGTAGRAFTAISEASGGSDPARAIRCRAERRGDVYVINGTKLWTTHAGTAAWGVLYARTGEMNSRRGITAFIVDANATGLTKRPIEVMSSYRPYELHFDNVEVPVEDRIGEEGTGFTLAGEFLVAGRINYAAGPIGIAQLALAKAIDWVKQRETFGSKLADKQGIQWMIADSEIELRAARLLMYQAAWKADLGQEVKVDASICKLYATEAAFRVLDRCVQMLGALGLSAEAPFERWFRDLRVKRLGEGPTEVQRMVVARQLLSDR
ncbi:MAG: putative acyl-CoA dehydrogenase [Mycobacterium sp.]|nr:putative acyl-CoA dehydrogenase [Mycobacterium sp.]